MNVDTGTTLKTLKEIESLVDFDGRRPGSDAERRAANHLQGRLESLGRKAEIEATSVWPNWAPTHALHALIAVVGSVLAVSQPEVGGALVLLALISTFGDASGAFLLLRRLTGRRASQNVLSREDAGKPGVLVLVAHYDAAHGGALFSAGVRERLAALRRTLRFPLGAFGPFFLSIAIVLVCVILRIVGIESSAVTVVQFVPTVLLIVSIPLLLDVQLAEVVPGANDNASGVATVLGLAERFGGRLEHFDLWVLFTGGQEAFAHGMRAWMRRHKRELDRERTVFLNVDEVGSGTVRYARGEGAILTSRSHPQLLELCAQIAEDDAGRTGARGISSRTTSDAHIARRRSYPAISIGCAGALDTTPHHHQPDDKPDQIDERSLERASVFCSELIGRLDGQVGPRLVAGESTHAA